MCTYEDIGSLGAPYEPADELPRRHVLAAHFSIFFCLAGVLECVESVESMVERFHGGDVDGCTIGKTGRSFELP